MDSNTGLSRAISARYPLYVYLVLIGVVCDMMFMHYNTMSVKNRIVELEHQHGITLQHLSRVRRFASTQHHIYNQIVRSNDKSIQQRVKRGLEEKSKPVFAALDALRTQVLRLLNDAVVNKGSCMNATLVCEKGERGERGPVGQRGLKGEPGAKGDRGFAGQKGQRGMDGARGLKGQKGDRGSPGKSFEQPKIARKYRNEVTARESTNLTLKCEASGYPTPTIQWVIDRKKFDSRYTFPKRGVLFITKVRKSDDGTIKCIAENILGKDTISIKLVVHMKPKVILKSRTLIATMGIPFKAVCSARGKPYPTLKWKRGLGGYGKGIAQSHLSKNRTSLILRIAKPSTSESGWYVCEAKNYIGRSVGSFYLKVIQARDCSGYKGNKKSGIYVINPDRKKPFRVYCDMKTSKGGWTVIQRRADGSVDFYRKWNDYKLGFGNLKNEFWLGNDKLHRLTKRKNMMIRFDLEDFSGRKAYAEYKLFYIDGEKDNYRLHVKSYSGTAGDSMTYHNGMQFSTKDRDRDQASGNCATRYSGAWWYKACYYSSLNGKYFKGPHASNANGVSWYYFKGYSSLKKTEIKLRPLA